MLSRLYGILLSRKAECVITHRMKYIEALKPLIAGINVAGDISERVSYMKARA